MSKGDKFSRFTAYLRNNDSDFLTLSFSQIEEILGFKLSPSAYLYEAQWANTESQSLPMSWIRAGFHSCNLNLTEKSISFSKTTVESKSHAVNFSVKTITAEEAKRCILTYFQVSQNDPNGRYLSWCHCYNAFVRTSFYDYDYLALHLAFYLASWGMYRGSSFLLQKDYKVHISIVKIILEKRYDPLRGISAEKLLDTAMLDLLDELGKRIHDEYASQKPSFEGRINDASETLITKILLGTLGCVPAYDRYYCEAVKSYGISSAIYNRKSIKQIAMFYISHKEEFELVRKEIAKAGTDYPPMKLMDMCMWQLAYEMEQSQEIE
jgi:hypothetical protein